MVSEHGLTKECGLLVNSARAIIYASGEEDFAAAAGKTAAKVQIEMKGYLDRFL
jgi:orotidine-5'-phosphate decarboxylase